MADKYASDDPLPGGVEKYFETLIKLLGHVGDKTVDYDALVEFVSQTFPQAKGTTAMSIYLGSVGRLHTTPFPYFKAPAAGLKHPEELLKRLHSKKVAKPAHILHFVVARLLPHNPISVQVHQGLFITAGGTKPENQASIVRLHTLNRRLNDRTVDPFPTYTQRKRTA